MFIAFKWSLKKIRLSKSIRPIRPIKPLEQSDNYYSYISLEWHKSGNVTKIYTSKQILQRLSIAFAHGKETDISKKLLNEIWQIIYTLYQVKEIITKSYKNVINLM